MNCRLNVNVARPVRPLKRVWVVSDSNDQFNELVQVEYPGLFAASNIIVMDHSIAEEIVQDALEKTYLRWKKIQRYDRPGAWVRRIVINASLSHIRRRRVERAHLTQLEQFFETSTRESDLTHFVLWSEVANLPDQQATAVAMHYGADMAIDDIAIELQLSDAAVKSLLYRARNSLRENAVVQEIAQ